MDCKETGLDVLTEEIDLIYRINSRRTRIRGRPREIIRFTKRKMRDIVLRLLDDKGGEEQDKDILFLREIPWRIREKRAPALRIGNCFKKG